MAETSLTHTSEQRDFQQALRALLDRLWPETVTPVAMETETGYDPTVWAAFVRESGAPGVAVAERFGGAGGGLTDLVIVFEQLGRRLSGLPMLSSVALAATALAAACDPPTPPSDGCAGELLTAIVAGDLTATLAVPTGGESLRAEHGTGGFTVTGRVEAVLDGGSADTILVIAETPEGPTLLALDSVTVEALPTLDLTRKFAALDVSEHPARQVGLPGDGARVARTAVDTARVCLAAEQLGGAERCLEEAVEYARQRHQFGRPIGSFQAVKHRCADMLVGCETLRTAVRHAAWAADADDPREATAAAAVAKAVGSEVYVSGAGANLQVHGGIGFTWEHTAHLHLKRAKAMEIFLGEPLEHRRALAAHLGLLGADR